MSVLWSQDQTLLFLETLKSEPVLWDPIKGKDKRKSHDAWLRVQEIFSLPIEDLKRKKESLISTYRGYLRKKQVSMQTASRPEDVYQPVWFAYDFIDNFLGPVIRIKPSRTSDPIGVDIKPSPNEYGEVVTSWTVEAPSPAAEDTENSTEETSAHNNTKRKQNRQIELKITSHQKPEALKSNTSEDEHECDVFGKFIAKKLKKLPEIEQDDMMFEIHALFRRPRRIERLNSCSDQSN